ncbi:GatB/YqeY domain-containing protein [Croceicoccus sp. F390]|uniref:GatB/YqeY domain-containing protein n=1 Tax=Croceicoccus esteveae TaxID=3075597 RepID=A0ABU2ZET0_9SPHN|nr:GatB/YqeY domain-containing protein [Croceicoccus sp. F390]MDT0575105.1 GatB/YqeY domain-containing protein [Croceicoccus sp. F390]
MLRDTIKSAQVSAMKAKEKERLATIRLILARVKDRDIELRVGSGGQDDDAMIVDVLQKMAKQRKESIALYRQGNREDLAAAEQAELVIIEEFLPQQLGEEETRQAIAAIIAELGAGGIKDMGKVMSELKARHGAVLDMSNASRFVKESLS